LSFSNTDIQPSAINSESIQPLSVLHSRAVARSENPGGHVVLGGDNKHFNLFYAKEKSKNVFAHKMLKNLPQKLLRKTQLHFFFLTTLSCLNGSNRRIHVPKCGLYIDQLFIELGHSNYY
jgi:hypothetical protein